MQACNNFRVISQLIALLIAQCIISNYMFRPVWIIIRLPKWPFA